MSRSVKALIASLILVASAAWAGDLGVTRKIFTAAERQRPGPNFIVGKDADRPSVGFLDEVWYSYDTTRWWNGTGTGWTEVFPGIGPAPYTAGGIFCAPTTTTTTWIADVATGNALISAGSGTCPSYGKIGLTTHISGTLAVANGGTGATTLTGYVKGNGTSAFTVATLPFPVADGGTGAATLTSNGVLYGNGTGVVQATSQGAANSVLVGNGGAPSFTVSPTLGFLRLVSSGATSGASQLTLDQFSSTTSRLIAWGPNASTNGAFSFDTIRSDGSNEVTTLAVGSNGTVIIGGGTNTVYRCTASGGSAAIGTLTIDINTCGGSAGTDTKLRVP